MKCPRCDCRLESSDRYCGRCGLARSADGRSVDPLLGLTIGDRYRIDERIGVGGMGTVYKGTHTRLGQRVAIKVLHERYAADEKLIQRFEKEALTYGQVCHPNLVSLHDFGRTDAGMFYMVLEYCPGISLAKLIRDQGRLKPLLAADIILQIAQGLGEAHKEGIIHRDLKPENVILTNIRPGHFHVRLLDFGIAKHIDDDGPRLTQAGMVFGTPEYMAPEQARGKKVDGRSDIYALGTMLYELLAGDPPFVGSDKLRIMHQQAHDEPPPLHEVVPGLSVDTELDGIVVRALRKEPKARYENTAVLISALEAYIKSAQRGLIPTSTVNSAQQMTKETSQTTSAMMPSMSDSLPTAPLTGADSSMTLSILRRPSVLAAVGVASIFLLAVGWFHYASHEASEDPQATTAHQRPANTEVAGTKAPYAKAEVIERRSEQETTATPSKSARPSVKPSHRVAKPTQNRARPRASAPVGRPSAEQLQQQRAQRLREERALAAKKQAEEARLRARRIARSKSIDEARTLLQKGRFEAAAVLVENLYKADRQDERTRTLRNQIIGMRKLLHAGQVAYRSGHCGKAVKTMKRVLEVSPKLSKASAVIENCQFASPPTQL